MGLEDWKNPIEQNIEKKDSDNLESSERRHFLKISLKVGRASLALGVTSSLAWKGLEGAMKFFDEDEKDEINSENEESFDTEIIKTSKQVKEITKYDKKEKQELSGVEKIADSILQAYNSTAVARRFDSKIFTKNFVMAEQYQESRYKENSESESGAEGVYQNKPKSTIDVVKYLNFLKKITANLPAKYQVNYIGPASITMLEARGIGELFKKKSDYGRAVGKLYLLSIHDKETDYNTKNPDVFRDKTPIEQQKLLLIAYHDGPARRLNPDRTSKNGKNYVKHVFKHMQTISSLRDQLAKANMSPDLDYAIIKIMRELERKENFNNQEAVKIKWLKKLQIAHMAKWQKTGNYDERLSNEEIREIF